MRNVWSFVKAVAGHWVLVSTGTLATVWSAAYPWLVTKTGLPEVSAIPQWVFSLLAIAALFAAFYLAWSEQLGEVERAKGELEKLTKPIFMLEITHAFFVQRGPDCLAVFYCALSSLGTQSTCAGFAGTLKTTDGKSVVAQSIWIDANGIQIDLPELKQVIPQSESLAAKTSSDGVPNGSTVFGVIACRFSGISCAVFGETGNVVDITFLDIYRKSHSGQFACGNPLKELAQLRMHGLKYTR